MLRTRPSSAVDDDQHPGARRSADRGADTGPRFSSRAALPSGRAVVGAMLIAVAAVGVFAAYLGATGGPTQLVVVAATDVPAGRVLGPGDLRSERVELPASLLEQTFGHVDDLAGAVTLAPLRAGELVQAGAVAPARAGAPPSFREFSFAVDRERAVDGELHQGERVDVLATLHADDQARTEIVARGVPIVAVVGGGKSSSIGAGGKLTITVSATSSDDVLRLVHATQTGSITLVRTTYASTDEQPALDAVGGELHGDQRTGTPPPTTSGPSTTTGPPASTADRDDEGAR